MLPVPQREDPSFVVSPSKGVYKCFGCGEGGNAVNFVMKHESMTFPEALKAVAKRYGIEIKEQELSEEEVRRNDDRESMFALNGWAADYFADYLYNSEEGRSVGLTYFSQKRGFTEATIRKFGLGYCSAQGRPSRGPHARRAIGRSIWSIRDSRSAATATARSSTASATV